jgi:hypothetical protein
MKRIGMFVPVAALLAFALSAAPEANAAKKKPGGVHSMTGCLQKGEGSTFTLTNVEGTGPKTVEIVGSAPAANLSAHVGHKIEITGTAVSAKQAAKAEGDKKNMKEERSEHHMRVQSVKMLARTCP